MGAVTGRQALVVPAGVWLSPEAARSVVLGLASLESLLRRHRSARLSKELQEVRQTLTWAIDASSAANVRPLALSDSATHARGDLIGVSTAAQVLGITPGAVRDRARRGCIPAAKVGGRWLVDLSQLNQNPTS
ncbi:helix-turn-helix domain-containing protein [Dietzia sp. SLG310A2-38A2]|nr:helix-turn-helix domain-containing protein [Dietzia sp. SLG310A2-38A2]